MYCTHTRRLRICWRNGPTCAKRRQAVVIGQRRYTKFPLPRRRRTKSRSSRIGTFAKPPTASNAVRRTKRPRSPNAMRCQRTLAPNANRFGQNPRRSNLSRNTPDCTEGSAMADRIALSAPLERRVSACRNNRISPAANRAPAFICSALPFAAETTVATGSANRQVPSLDPPSHTMISHGPGWVVMESNASDSQCSSFQVGMMTETRTSVPVGQNRHSRQVTSFQKLKHGSAPGRDMGDLRRKVGLADRGYRVAAPDDGNGLIACGFGQA